MRHLSWAPRAWASLPGVFGGLAFGLGAAAQEVPRAPVVVDYVGVEGVYLPVGTELGAQVGDTLQVFATVSDATPLGALVITAAARSRSVATMLAPRFPLQSGDSIYVPLAPSVTAEAPSQRAAVAADPARASSTRAATSGGARISGRVSFDLDVRETLTSWEGQDLFGATRRRFATPVSSLSLRVSDLPGGFRLETNLRGSYRYSDGPASIQPATSVRVYNLALARVANSTPFELRVGRFYNPHESYSSYWDGALVRLGRRTGPGIGVVAGFEPDRGNEGLSQDFAKVTSFVDYRKRGGSWSYATDLSFHYVQSSDSLFSDRMFVGWSQQLSLGGVSLNQRLRVDRDDLTGEWALAQLRLRAGVSVAGPLRLNFGFGRTRPGVLRGESPLLASDRGEFTAGFSVLKPGTSLLFDVGSTQWTGEERGISFSGSASQDLGSVLVYVSGRHWSRGRSTSLGAGPGFSFAWHWLATRIGYQLYRTESTAMLTSHSGSVEFTATPSGGLWVSLRGEEQWGGNFGGTRLRFTVGRSF